MIPRLRSLSAWAISKISAGWASRLATGFPKAPAWASCLDVAKPDRPGVERLAHQPAHLGDLGWAGGPLGRVVAHHVGPQRGVPDHHRGVEADAR